MDEIKPTLKLMTKQDFDYVKGKYHNNNIDAQKVINQAKPLDVLALQVIPDSGLKILNAKIFNEESEELFLKSLREGIFSSDFEFARAESLSPKEQKNIGSDTGLVIIKKSLNQGMTIEPVKNGDFVGFLINRILESGVDKKEFTDPFNNF